MIVVRLSQSPRQQPCIRYHVISPNTTRACSHSEVVMLAILSLTLTILSRNESPLLTLSLKEEHLYCDVYMIPILTFHALTAPCRGICLFDQILTN